MSNEVNIHEIAFGTLDPGVGFDLYFWGTPQSYDSQRKKVRFFSIAPDPELPFGSGTLELVPGSVNLEITRVWNTVWGTFDEAANNSVHVFQTNVEIQNVGDSTSAYHLLQAETDN